MIVGAGDGPCLVLAVGARDRSTGPDWGAYTVDEAAQRHGAGVERETTEPPEAYARFPRERADAVPGRLATRPGQAVSSYTRRVSKVCSVCGKKPSFGNSRSHSMVATRRRFEPNLQRVRILVNGVAKRAYVCTRCLKGGKVQKAAKAPKQAQPS